jgi:hypothetical protein
VKSVNMRLRLAYDRYKALNSVGARER